MSGDVGGLCALGNSEEWWNAFKTTVLDVAGGCLRTHRKVKKNFVSQRTLDTIDQSRKARLIGMLSCSGSCGVKLYMPHSQTLVHHR